MERELQRTGYLDEVSDVGIRGWAWDPRRPNLPEVVEILVDGELLVSMAANLFREDLAQAGKGDGRHSFVVPLPSWLGDGQEHVVSARFSDSDQMLQGSPRSFTFEASLSSLSRDETETWVGLEAVLANAAAKRRLVLFAAHQPVPSGLAYQAYLARALRAEGWPVLTVRTRPASPLE
jgi:hypothetical protein